MSPVHFSLLLLQLGLTPVHQLMCILHTLLHCNPRRDAVALYRCMPQGMSPEDGDVTKRKKKKTTQDSRDWTCSQTGWVCQSRSFLELWGCELCHLWNHHQLLSSFVSNASFWSRTDTPPNFTTFLTNLTAQIFAGVNLPRYQTQNTHKIEQRDISRILDVLEKNKAGQ